MILSKYVRIGILNHFATTLRNTIFGGKLIPNEPENFSLPEKLVTISFWIHFWTPKMQKLTMKRPKIGPNTIGT